MVPAQPYKAMHSPKRREAGANLIENTTNSRPQNTSTTERENIAGLNKFPAVKDGIYVD